MDNLIAEVAGAAGVEPDVARKAVALILDFLKREAPEERFMRCSTRRRRCARSPRRRTPAAKAWATPCAA